MKKVFLLDRAGVDSISALMEEWLRKNGLTNKNIIRLRPSDTRRTDRSGEGDAGAVESPNQLSGAGYLQIPSSLHFCLSHSDAVGERDLDLFQTVEAAGRLSADGSADAGRKNGMDRIQAAY